MDGATNLRIEEVISRVLGQQSMLGKLIQVENDLLHLHDQLAHVLNADVPDVGFWSASLPIQCDRTTFDAMPGEATSHASTYRPFYVKHPTPVGLIALYCYEPAVEAPDHDLTAENAPDEWVETMGPWHVFHRPITAYGSNLAYPVPSIAGNVRVTKSL